MLLEKQADVTRLTKTEKLVLDYMIKHGGAVCFMTSGEIARALDVGASTVVRLSKKLGFDSFTALRKELQAEAADRPVPYTRLEESGRLSEEQLMDAFTKRIISHIQTDSGPDGEEKLRRAADMILGARRVWVVGNRVCAGFGSSMATMLSCCRPEVHFIGHSPVDRLVGLTGGDVMIAISFSRYSRDTLFAAQMAHDQGCPVIAMTDAYTSPLLEYAVFPILCTVDNFSFFNAYTSLVMTMEKLVLLVAHRSRRETEERLRQMERYLDITNQY